MGKHKFKSIVPTQSIKIELKLNFIIVKLN
nr:MAG TPA: hypothetical protein [Bacteriophage sp.]